MSLEWKYSDTEIEYPDAMAFMESRVADIVDKKATECIWLLEHPPLYTSGTSAEEKDLITPDRFPVFNAGRGGQYTYHGPGQRIAYTLLDLRSRGQDVRKFVWKLEEWVILTLKDFNIEGERRCGRVGIWVTRSDIGQPEREDKIAAIGVRLRKWVTFHGISINLEPDLTHFDGIIPCGIKEHGVTSFLDLGITASMIDLDIALKRNFKRVFEV